MPIFKRGCLLYLYLRVDEYSFNTGKMIAQAIILEQKKKIISMTSGEPELLHKVIRHQLTRTRQSFVRCIYKEKIQYITLLDTALD